ncbi:DoxX family protein [Maritimibacter dapengensis]|uniref:DoxX family protein n=1 Tax=Maritimibacter dapengensis TaxID=2836868 RepID=A0ABS6T650_9RHOB|nr:DoxX family protein [Maritimibacter dapengensis]MBV7380430.1 DoxX family protein [Maritimibacter dapengensis]
MDDWLNLAGRVLIALIFFGGFAQKIGDPGPVQGMIEGIGLPGWMVWPVAIFNLVAGIALLTGPWVPAWALVLAGYCLFTSYFHWQLRADPWQVSIMVKNWAIAGGLLILAAQGPGRLVLFGRGG